jgi:membrane protein DedA with SNARE-associated domain
MKNDKLLQKSKKEKRGKEEKTNLFETWIGDYGFLTILKKKKRKRRKRETPFINNGENSF